MFGEKIFSMGCEDSIKTRSLNHPIEVTDFKASFDCVPYAKVGSYCFKKLYYSISSDSAKQAHVDLKSMSTENMPDCDF